MRLQWREILLILATLALMLLIITPFINLYGRFTSLDGTVGAIDHPELWLNSDPLTMITYFFGDIFCPQIMSRSFILNGSQMAFCIRDVSVLIGIVAGLVFSYTEFSKMIGFRKSILMISYAFIILMIDWAIQHTMGVDVATSRILTGTFFGFALMCVLSSYENLIRRM